MSKKPESEISYDLKSGINPRKTLFLGAGWQGMAELFRVSWSAIVVLLLASMLNPGAFGLVGMTDVLVQFFNIFMAMGFDAAVIQQERMNETILSSLFWLNVVGGLFLTGLGIAISPILAWFYQESQVAPIFSILSIVFILQSFSVVQRGLLGRQLAFRAIAIVDMLASFLSAVAAILVALMGGSYWSLVVLQISKHILTSIGYWFSSSWRPQFSFNLRSSLSSMRFSGNILIFNILNFLATRSDIIIIGRLLGAEELGFYLLANQLIFRPVGQILNVVNRTFYPVLAAIQQNLDRVREVFVKGIIAVFSILAPFIVLISILAPFLVPFQLGIEWLPMVPILLVWCIGGIRRLITQQNGILFLTMNRPDLQWKYQLISTPIVTGSLFLGVRWGGLGVSISFNLAQLAVSFISMHLAFSLINLSVWNYLKQYKYAVSALVLESGVGILLVRWLMNYSLHPYLITIIVGLVAIIFYVVALYFLDSQVRQLWRDFRLWMNNYGIWMIAQKSESR